MNLEARNAQSVDQCTKRQRDIVSGSEHAVKLHVANGMADAPLLAQLDPRASQQSPQLSPNRGGAAVDYLNHPSRL
eukprot:4862972-Pleurochrysis_carterae.AAC.1